MKQGLRDLIMQQTEIIRRGALQGDYKRVLEATNEISKAMRETRASPEAACNSSG